MQIKVTNRITPKLNQIQNELAALVKGAYQEFIKYTPVRSGNARRKTRLVGQVIKARYPYALRLDKGYSRQSPKGMSQPTRDYIYKRVREILRK